MKKVRRVVIAANVSGYPGRLWLSGILRYMAEKKVQWNWRLLRNECDLTLEGLRRATDDCLDGVILATPRATESIKGLSSGKYALVVVGTHAIDNFMASRGNVTMIGADNLAIGKLAAGHLLWASSFESYAYIGPRGVRPWAELRRQGFEEVLQARGLACVVYDRVDDGRGQKSLLDFVRNLPKPAAIFASHDDRALEVAGVCRELGVSIPGQVSLIGVDDDPVVCESGGMSLTSIEQGCEEVGHRAAACLDEMMRRKHNRSRVVHCGSPKVVMRHSTEPDSRQAKLVQEALGIIHREVFQGLSVPDLARRLGVSRRLLDLRFQELQGRPVSALMRELRLAEARRMLSQTQEPIDGIALRCGYPGNCSLKRAFKDAYGVSMRDFRKSARISPSGEHR